MKTVNQMLEPFNVLRVDSGNVFLVLRSGHRRQISTDIKECILNLGEHTVDFDKLFVVSHVRSSQANARVRLVHRAVGFDPLREFLDPFATVQTSFARIARFGVNLHDAG